MCRISESYGFVRDFIDLTPARTDRLVSAHLGFAPSNDEGTLEVGSRFGADMLDTAFATGAEIIVAQAVALKFDGLLKTGLKCRPLGRIYLNLENRILHALAEITTSFGDTAQSASATWF